MSDMFEKGLAIRKAVLGKEYVEKSLAGADDFTRPMQELVTKYCWGEVWGNGNLSRRDRSLLNLAMLSILNRPHELKLHVKGAHAFEVSRAQGGEKFQGQSLVLVVWLWFAHGFASTSAKASLAIRCASMPAGTPA